MLKMRDATTAAIFLSAVVASGGFAPSVQAKSFSVLHSFTGGPSDGDDPKADVAFDGQGNLYGTTYNGGTAGYGAIYKIDTHGSETLLHSFDGSTGGAYPAAGVTIDAKTGDLYGVTQAGGGACGCGTLYKLAADGTFTVLHAFANGTSDGSYPQWRMIADKQGNLYGVTQSGGTNSDGTLFEYAKNGSFSILHSFDNSSATPTGRLALDRDGNLYGVNGVGGTSTACSGHGCGAIYRLSPDGTFFTLYSFGDGIDGRYPQGGLTIDKKGNLYGTAAYGGTGTYGTVFELPKKGSFAILYSFSGANGANPAGEVLLVKDDLYTTTYSGGANGLGAVVKITPKGVGTLLYSFTGDDGGLPIAGLVEQKSRLYGTASLRGPDGHGTVFSVKKK